MASTTGWVDLVRREDADEARYALDGLPNPVLASEYRLALPDEKALEVELARTRQELDARSGDLSDP